MRLQLALTRCLVLGLLAWIAWPAAARAAPDATAYGVEAAAVEVDARINVYSDQWITVVSPALRASAPVGAGVDVEVGVTVDAVSGATRAVAVDAVSSATHFAEKRVEAHLALGWRPSAESRVAMSYLTSLESDYETHAVGVTGNVEIFDRRASVFAGYRLSLETLGTVNDPTYEEGATSHALDLSWAHILGPETVLTVLSTVSVTTCGARLGCHASPYRFVPLRGADAAGPHLAVPERHPDERVRAAAALQLTQYLGAGLALHAGYRFYADTWRVQGHTGEVALARGFFSDRLLLRLEGRLSHQGGASFSRERYLGAADPTGLPAYRTADRELTEIWGVQAGLRVDWTSYAVGPFERFGASGALFHHWYHYPRVTVSPDRRAWVVGGGLHASF